MLEKILDGNIQIIDSVSDWKESIKIAGKPLLQKNIITANYITAMIESIEKLINSKDYNEILEVIKKYWFKK